MKMHRNIKEIRNRVYAIILIVLLLGAIPIVLAQSPGTFSWANFVQQGSAPASPSSGQNRLYFDTSDNLKEKNNAGTVKTILYTDGSLAALTGLGGDLSGSGGSAVVNSLNGKAVSLAGSFTTSGANALTLTTTGATNVTLPTSGTLQNASGTVANFSGSLAGDVSGTQGATSVDKVNGKTVLLGGALTTSGAFATTFTMTGTTNVTFPTSGTLLTTGNLVSGTNISISGATINTTANIAATQQISNAGATTVSWTGTPTLNWNNGNMQIFTLTGNSTVTFSNPASGGAHYVLLIIQDATGGRSITWPATVKWSNNTAFDFTKMPASGSTLVDLELEGDGNYYAKATPLYAANQVFTGTLDASGTLAITGTNLQNLAYSVVYTSALVDANAAPYLTCSSNTSCTLSNSGAGANSGVTVKVTFFDPIH